MWSPGFVDGEVKSGAARDGAAGEGSRGYIQLTPTPEPEHVDDAVIREWNQAGGFIRTSTRPTLNLLLLLHASVRGAN